MKETTESKLIVLCQPDEQKSCGACCGLYNYVDSSRESLVLRLRARTARFRKMVKNPDDIKCYVEATLAAEDGTKRYEVIYCCEYIGFLDAAEKKVGCLLHPMQNSGLDMRTVSFYGQETCAGHLCPSHHFIPPSQAQILLRIIEDWYLYGLCLTDIDLVVDYFRMIADRIGEALKPEVFENEALRNIARDYFHWKINWPFRSDDTNRLGKYYFDGSQYMISYIDYEKFGREISPLNKIFLSLSSTFKNTQEIAAAEELVMANVGQFVAEYRKHF
ncbi:MAG: hypothetical protein CVU52_08200 [Deltaproteobacteria bacterium HGW-Deltaproteobacteria-10]|nr:MAG: hypothetical protein CVU52_08200 [Deltaproteobacteria bacterium HGW-Deltaproteobacteria-10]